MNDTTNTPTQKDDIEELQQLHLCSEFTKQQCNAFAQKVNVVRLEKGEYLLREGHVDCTLYIVMEGKLEVLKGLGNGDDLKLTVLKPGDMAGQSGFIDDTPHSANIRAKKDSVVCALERDTLEEFLKTDPEIAYKVMRAIVRSVHKIVRNMNNLHAEMNKYITKAHGRY